ATSITSSGTPASLRASLAAPFSAARSAAIFDPPRRPDGGGRPRVTRARKPRLRAMAHDAAQRASVRLIRAAVLGRHGGSAMKRISGWLVGVCLAVGLGLAGCTGDFSEPVQADHADLRRVADPASPTGGREWPDPFGQENGLPNDSCVAQCGTDNAC